MEESPYKGKTGVAHLLNAWSCSIDGIRSAFRHEDAFRLEVAGAVILIPLAFYLEPLAIDRALMISAVLLVLIAELLNSALESALDRVSLESHPLIKRAKDMGSAAVLIALLNAAVIWLLLLLE